jgi:hypothetical protein
MRQRSLALRGVARVGVTHRRRSETNQRVVEHWLRLARLRRQERHRPAPACEALGTLLLARQQLVDHRRWLLNEAETLLGELPAAVAERPPGGRLELELFPGTPPEMTASRSHVSVASEMGR